MNIPPSEAKQLTLGEYQGLMFNWNKAQGGDKDELEPPSHEQIARRQERLVKMGVKVLN